MKKFTRRLSMLVLCLIALCACSPTEQDTSKSKEKQHQVQNESKDPTPKDENSPTSNSSALSSLKQIVENAKMGRVNSSDFAAGVNTILEVEKQWGQPVSVDKVENNYYANYPAKNLVFGYNENKNLIDVRSYDKSLQSLTLQQIQGQLGEPAYKRVVNHDQIYGYQINSEFELRFIIPENTGKVDHISVLSVKDAVVGDAPTPYIVEIKGVSNNLSATAWKAMQAWRGEMISVVKNNQGSVFLNGPDRKMVALTFDDGPDNRNTPLIIEILAKYNVRGNFFFIGEKVKKFPDVVKKAYMNGNNVLSHSYYHHDLSKRSAKEIAEDLAISDQTLYEVIGKKPALLRPPFGAVNDTVISTAIKHGENIVLWSIDTLDWSQKESKNITNNVLTNARNGDIILMHSNEDKSETVSALPAIIEGLQQRGFEIVGLETLLNQRAYK
jgi:peptidoglycan/xylan/chitin deacetylase (PgdA/CDA1 family)